MKDNNKGNPGSEIDKNQNENTDLEFGQDLSMEDADDINADDKEILFDDDDDDDDSVGEDTEDIKEYINKSPKNFEESFLQKQWKYIAAAAGVVIVIAIIFVFTRNNNSRTAGESVSSPETMSISGTKTTEETLPTDFTSVGLQKDAIPEINSLISNYFNAITSIDMDALTGIVANVDNISEEQLQKEGEYIESYGNISCYTTPAIEDDSYLVYVYHEIKFLNVETAAPSLIFIYVDKNEAGEYQINNSDKSTYSDEFKALMTEVEKTEDFKNLAKETDDKFNTAIGSDQALNNLYIKLREGAEAAAETTAEETTPAPEETTAAPTEAAETTAAGSDGFTSKSETVEALENCKIRSTPSTDGEVLGTLPGGNTIERIGTNDSWSKVSYNGQEGYILSELLTTNLSSGGGSSFTSVNETVTATVNCKIRATASTDGEVLGTLPGGNTITRTGVNDTWSRVEYNGQTAYIASEFLQ